MKLLTFLMASTFVASAHATKSVTVSVGMKLDNRNFIQDVNGKFHDKGNGTCGGYGCDAITCKTIDLKYVGQINGEEVYLGSEALTSRSGIDFNGPANKATVDIAMTRTSAGKESFKINASLDGRNSNYSTWERYVSSLSDFEQILIIGKQEEARFKISDGIHNCGKSGCPVFETPYLIVTPCK